MKRQFRDKGRKKIVLGKGMMPDAMCPVCLAYECECKDDEDEDE